MNVYDFDGTIYAGDSTIDFYLFVLRHHPSLLRYLPGQLHAIGLYAFQKLDKTAMKQSFFSFLRGINTDEMVNQFWHHHKKKIQPWYLAQQQPTDLIISASPEFLLEPICQQLNVRLLGSRIDPCTGVFQGENCRGEEKIHRFHLAFPGENIECFYSDNSSDAPMAANARQAFLVRKGTPTPWNP